MLCSNRSMAGSLWRYEPKRVLGSGSTAVVYLAEDTFGSDMNGKQSGQLAMKVVDLSKVRGDSALANEARIHKSMSHPNIVDLKETIVTDSHVVFVMEYLSGGDLFDAICPEEGMEDELKCKQYFTQIVDAIKYMHQNGFVHRDIKPENVILDGNGDVCKLADFGFSCKTDNPILEKVAGTMSYMAPECYRIVNGRFMPNRVPSHELKAVDVWALGVLLFTMVAGSFPWACASTECMEFVDFCEDRLDFYPWTTFSPELIHLFKRVFCLNPKKRCTVEEVATLLEDCDSFYRQCSSTQEQELVDEIESSVYREGSIWTDVSSAETMYLGDEESDGDQAQFCEAHEDPLQNEHDLDAEFDRNTKQNSGLFSHFWSLSSYTHTPVSSNVSLLSRFVF
eukprot:Nk52_evm14s219 gene=Nk52_evmTU14s219